MLHTEDQLSTLWAGCLNNNRKHQELLYRALAPKMMAVCMRYARDKDEARDILQEGFIKMFTNAHRYRGEGSLEGWIRQIMVRTAITRYRKLKPMILVDDIAVEGDNYRNSYNAHQLHVNDLLKMIQKLPSAYRSVFNMHAIEGYSHQEIGRELGISELLSRTNVCRARTILKQMVTDLTTPRQYLAG